MTTMRAYALTTRGLAAATPPARDLRMWPRSTVTCARCRQWVGDCPGHQEGT